MIKNIDLKRMTNDKRYHDFVIYEDLEDKKKYLLNEGYDIAAVFAYGSMNYQMDIWTDNYQSDIDAIAFIIPKLKDLIEGKPMVSKTIILEDNSHIDIKDIRLLIELLYKANPSYLEILFTNYYVFHSMSVIPEILYDNKKFASMNIDRMLTSILGTIVQKSKNLCKDTPAQHENIIKYGYDSKQLCHALRFKEILKLITSGKNMADCMVLDIREYLNSIKTYEANIDVKQAEKMMEECVEESKYYVDEFRKNHGVLDLNRKAFAELKDMIYRDIYDEIVFMIRR